jgi:hypothetical protein
MATKDSAPDSALGTNPPPLRPASGPPKLPGKAAARPQGAPAAPQGLRPAPSPPQPNGEKPVKASARAARGPAEEMELDYEPPRHRAIIANASACLVSMVTHMGVLLALALVMLEPKEEARAPDLTVSVDPIEQEEPTMELDPITEASLEQNVSSSSASVIGSGASSATVAMSSEPTLDRTVTEAVTGPSVNFEGPISAHPGSAQLIANVPLGFMGDRRSVVDNYQEAMDRITQEILLMLSKQKVMLIWAFDQSESMKDDQAEIRDRVDKVYVELGLTSKAQGDALLTSIVSYGGDFAVHTDRPTNDLPTIRDAIDSVPVDPTGKELMCSALGRAIGLHKPLLNGRKMAIVLVTDETGDRQDNDKNLETMIGMAKASNCTVYILGREAVFGYPYAHFRWVEPNNGTVHWLPVDRGPETAFVEQLQTDGFRRRYDAHSSGFGPYEQSRIAVETGGIFFMLPSEESNIVRGERRRYELEAMRAYKPDLRSKVENKVDIDNSAFRSGVVKVIYDLNPWQPQIAKYIEMRHHFAPTPADFVQQVAQEQSKAIVYLQYLDKAIQMMKTLEKDRVHEYSPRWQANFDLVYGQLYAYTVRIYAYGAGLEEFKRNPPTDVPFTKPPNLRLVHWDIHTQKKLLSAEKGQEYIDLANEHFARVIKEHPGTPWAARAEWEIKRGYGVGLAPAYDYPRPPGKPAVPTPKL